MKRTDRTRLETSSEKVKEVHLAFLSQMIKDVATGKYIVNLETMRLAERQEKRDQDTALEALLMSINKLGEKFELTDYAKAVLMMTEDQVLEYQEDHPPQKNQEETNPHRKHDRPELIFKLAALMLWLVGVLVLICKGILPPTAAIYMLAGTWMLIAFTYTCRR